MTISLNINHISGRPPYIIITITITITTTIMFTITITITLIPEVQKAADLADISVLSVPVESSQVGSSSVNLLLHDVIRGK